MYSCGGNSNRGGLLAGVHPAFAAGTCIQDVWQAHGNSQALTCTANDVTLASVSNICVDDGTGHCKAQNTCTSGGNVTFTADFTMPLTAQARYDLGLYIASDGGGSDGALTGQCIANIITPANSTTFINLDPPPDICGDIDGTHTPQIIHQTITTACVDTNGDGKLNLPWATTWRQTGANQVCTSTNDAYPGSPSKCNEGNLNIDIFLETASIDVTKSVAPQTVTELGGSVVYTVDVKNLATVNTVTLDTLTDSIYGDITTTGHNGITATTCIVGPPAILAGQTYTCTFTVSMPQGNAGQTLTDTVTACGTDSQNHPNLCDNDNATVTYTDVFTDPTLTKTASSLNALQVDVNFTVTVTNNSTIDTLFLNTLTDDKFGNVLVAHPASAGPPAVEQVVTACTPQLPPAGIPPNINGNNNTFQCTFVGRITQTGLHTNIVDGTATDDDGAQFPASCIDDPLTPTIDESKCLEDSAGVNISITFP